MKANLYKKSMSLVVTFAPTEQPTPDVIESCVRTAIREELWEVSVRCADRFVDGLDCLMDWRKTELMGSMVECTLSLGLKARTSEPPASNWRKN